MEDHGNGPLSWVRRRVGRLAGAAAVVSVFREAARRDRDLERPGVVELDGRSNAVYERAEQLAGEGRDDHPAVVELIALADGDVEALRAAERASRVGGSHHESSLDNLTHRLLQGAVTGREVVSPTPELVERLRVLDTFDAQPTAQQWAQLVVTQPSLKEVEHEVRAGLFGQVALGAGRPSSDSERRSYVEHVAARRKLEARLGKLVGPDCEANDQLLSSQVAYDAALSYLTDPAS